jgi:hypothetical protein
VRACEIAWGIYKGVPDVPPPKAERQCLGDVFEARLEPLGAAKLHMVDLPSIDLSGREGGLLQLLLPPYWNDRHA